jgi:hypothetical protein
MRSLSDFVKNTRKSAKRCELHDSSRSKLVRQNFTRWNSSFLMLLSFYKSYNRGVFNQNYVCCQTKEEIESYLQILLPVYMLTNKLQKEKANISHVVPSILIVVYGYIDRMILENKEHESFKNFLVTYLLEKFQYELNSSIYLAAAILNISALKDWSHRSFSKIYFEKGISALVKNIFSYSNIFFSLLYTNILSFEI